MNDIFFVDREGNKIYNEKIASHIGLANLMIKESEHLKKEFEESQKNDPVDFLISKGYLKISNISYYRRVVYFSSKISDKQRRLLRYYCEEGYNLDDLTVNEMEKKNREPR